MTISVHTNKSALTALQNLNSTNDKLGETQNRINTGLRINNAKENAAVWAIAQGQRADIGALSAVTNSLNRATSIANVNQALGNLGSQAKQIDAHLNFVSKLTDVLEAGVGNLVDADLAKESARLQALQVQQQLGAQALSIANSAPQIILQLFRGG